MAKDVRAFFEIQKRLILSGEIVSFDDPLFVTLRLNGRPIFRGPKVQRRDRRDGMFEEAARAALQATQPDIGAAVAVDDGDPLTAIRLCDIAIGKGREPDANYAHSLKARTLATPRRRDQAIDEARTPFRLCPREPSSHDNLATLFADTGRRDQAIAEYKTANALAPQFALPHTGLAEPYRAMGRDVDAIERYATGVALGPSIFAPRPMMASALRALGHPDEALEEYRTAALLSPDRPGPHHRLGDDFRALGKNAIAIAWTFVRAYDALGAILRDLGRRDEAQEQEQVASSLASRP